MMPKPASGSSVTLPPTTGRIPRPGVMLFAALALTAAVYSNALHGPFVWDDLSLIDRSAPPPLSPMVYFGRAFWDSAPDRQADGFYYRPITSWSYAVDGVRGGGQPGPFHATNVLLHLGVVALVFLLARRLGANPVAAALGAALFGTLPRLTENVTWISGRTDVLASAFSLAALLTHGDGHAGVPRRLFSALLLFLGLCSKEVAAGAAAGLVALELAAARRGEKALRSALLDLAPAAVACGAYGWYRRQALQSLATATLSGIPHRWLMPAQALGRYALMLIDPRPQLQIGLLGVLEPLPLLIGAGLLLAWLFWLYHAAIRPPCPLAAGMAVTGTVALFLVLHFVRLRLAVVAADRFLYLPAACLATLLAPAAGRLPVRPRRWAFAAALLVFLVYAPLSVARNEDWADELRLWRAAVKTTDPRNPVPSNELGTALAHLGRHEEALDVYLHAIPLVVGEQKVLLSSNLAETLSDLGRFEDARRIQEEVVRLEPERPVGHYNLAVIDLRRLQFDVAKGELETALRLLPGYRDARRALEAVPELRTMAESLPPEHPDEPFQVRLARARLWSRLAVVSRAGPLWSTVLADPGAPRAVVEEGAAYLVAFGDQDTATRAVEAARRNRVSPHTLATLVDGLDDRFHSGAARRQ